MIAAKHFWPGFIIAQLSIAIIASFTILYFAQSDGGPQVIPDYYERSANYDDIYQARQASIELGWQVDVRLGGEYGELILRDRSGEPVDGASGSLAFYRPSLAEPVAISDVHPKSGTPGHYIFEDAAELRGLWDLDINLERGDDFFITVLRREIPHS